jgi:serine O-acetyltransferase
VNKLITELTNDLLASYAGMGGINHLDGVNLPSKSTISEITQDLLRLLFPGFFDDHLIHSCELRIETANLMDSVFGRLEDEVYKSFLHIPPEGLKKE